MQVMKLEGRPDLLNRALISDYAEKVLREPHCRHRAHVYYGDSRDTPKEKWDKLKKDAGLFWDEEAKAWILK